MGMKGRPTKYKASMCDTVVELMREGGSKAEVCAALDISPETMNQWCKTDGDYFNQEFSEAIKRGEQLSQGWWERKAREAAVGINTDANATMMIFNLKNRFPDAWRDKKELQANITTHEEALSLLDG